MQEIEYKDFSLNIHESMASHPSLKGHMELTFNCNLKCIHCYTSCCNKNELINKELSIDAVLKIIDQIAASGCLWLAFTGGEPLFREDFIDIYSYAKKKGMLITILTNGTLIDEKLSDYMMKSKPFCFDITLHGVNKETFEAVTQRKGSYEACMNGINLLRGKNVPFKLKTHITTLNYHELEEIRSYAESINVSHRMDYIIYPDLNGDISHYKYRMPTGLLKKWFKEDDMYEEDHRNGLSQTQSDHVISCVNGVNSFFVDPYGNLVFCNLIREPKFNLKDILLSDAVGNLYPHLRRQRYITDSKCKNCPIKDNCKKCAGISLLETKDIEAHVDYYCELAGRL